MVGLGDTEQHADDQHGHDGAEILDHIEAAGAGETVERPRQNSRTAGSSAFIALGVKTATSGCGARRAPAGPRRARCRAAAQCPT